MNLIPSRPQCTLSKIREYLKEVERTNEMLNVKCLAQCMAHSKLLLNVNYCFYCSNYYSRVRWRVENEAGGNFTFC